MRVNLCDARRESQMSPQKRSPQYFFVCACNHVEYQSPYMYIIMRLMRVLANMDHANTIITTNTIYKTQHDQVSRRDSIIVCGSRPEKGDQIKCSNLYIIRCDVCCVTDRRDPHIEGVRGCAHCCADAVMHAYSAVSHTFSGCC